MTDEELRGLIARVAALTESNARAIEANAAALAETRAAISETNQQLQNLGTDLMRGTHQVATEGDVRHAETQQRIQTLLEEAREDRRQFTRWLEGVQETVQTLILEIRRIWERLGAA